MKKNFPKFLEQLAETNATLGFYVDFEKVKKNIDKIKIKLNQLNYLVGHDDIKTGIEELFEENQKVFSVLGILIAIRKNGKKKAINSLNKIVPIETYFNTPELIFEYMNDTGLSSIFTNKNINNLVDYVFGVEVGLDTHARKNRVGDEMENTVAKIFQNNNIKFDTEIYNTDYQKLTTMGVDLKRFDFVINANGITYLIETNFYNSGGSKPNETARSYTDLAPKINQCDGFEFVWITDGQGWLKAKNKLEEAYSKIPKVYNLTTISEFINIVK